MKALLKKVMGRSSQEEPDLLPSEREAARLGAAQKALFDEVAELETRRKELEAKTTLTEDEALSLASIPPRINKLIASAQSLERGLANAKVQARNERARLELPAAVAELQEVAPPFRAACEKFLPRTRNERHVARVQAILRALDEAGL